MSRKAIVAQIWDEIELHREVLASSTGESFSDRMSAAQASQRIEEAEQRLRLVSEPGLTLELEGELADGHRLPVTTVTNILGRLQRTITGVSWSIRSGRSISGTVPAAVDRATSLDLLATAPGSFEFHFRHPSGPRDRLEQTRLDLDEPEIIEKAFETLGRWFHFEAGAIDAPETHEAIADLGPFAAKHLEGFVRALGQQDLTAKLQWQGTRSGNAVLTPDRATALADWLAYEVSETQVVDVRGTLRAADEDNGTFAIVDAAGNRYEGKAVEPSLVSEKTISREVSARLEQVLTELTSGAVVIRYRLLDISDSR